MAQQACRGRPRHCFENSRRPQRTRGRAGYKSMASIIDELTNKEAWEEFLEYKADRSRLGKRELMRLEGFVEEGRYGRFAGGFDMGLPEKKTISKMGSAKKRVVYSYGEEETWALKLIAFLLYRYDDKIPANCYSFRRSMTAGTAIENIRSIPGLDGKYVLKVDIHDYFNSINPELLIGMLERVVTDDPKLLEFLSGMLRTGKCVSDGFVIEEKMGAMAGVPTASFFANIYLMDLDRMFEATGIPYFRYSDDIIVFADSLDEVDECFHMISEHIAARGLTFNVDKYSVSGPGEPWEFLGFSYRNGEVDISSVTIEKMKGKIRRRARSLYRWRVAKGAGFGRTAAAMIRSFDRMFYDLTGSKEFTWTRYYFPVITTADGLHEIDEYMMMYLRYLYSGRHYKGNYRVRYQDLCRLGYTPLVAEYYNWKEEVRRLRDS